MAFQHDALDRMYAPVVAVCICSACGADWLRSDYLAGTCGCGSTVQSVRFMDEPISQGRTLLMLSADEQPAYQQRGCEMRTTWNAALRHTERVNLGHLDLRRMQSGSGYWKASMPGKRVSRSKQNTFSCERCDAPLEDYRDMLVPQASRSSSYCSSCKLIVSGKYTRHPQPHASGQFIYLYALDGAQYQHHAMIGNTADGSIYQVDIFSVLQAVLARGPLDLGDRRLGLTRAQARMPAFAASVAWGIVPS